MFIIFSLGFVLLRFKIVFKMYFLMWLNLLIKIFIVIIILFLDFNFNFRGFCLVFYYILRYYIGFSCRVN